MSRNDLSEASRFDFDVLPSPKSLLGNLARRLWAGHKPNMAITKMIGSRILTKRSVDMLDMLI